MPGATAGERAPLGPEGLDAALGALCRRAALCRRVLGRLGGRVLLEGAHRRLGFARVDDYARERLGMSGRELQELARVARALETLPRVGAAFDAGELSWSQVRLLATAATPATERAWLRRARGVAVRTLAALVAAARRSPHVDADDDFLDDEPAVRVHVACPRHVRRLWAEAAELASRMEGRRIPAWKTSEAVAAEGMAGEGACGASESSVHGARRGGGEAGCTRAVPLGAVRPTPDVVDGLSGLADVELLAAPWVREPHRLDLHLRMAVAALQSIDWEIGRRLAMLAARGFHRAFGGASFRDYVRERLGMSLRRARALLAVHRAAERHPLLGEAYRAGRLSMARALVMLPVLRADNVAAWVARAQEVTIRRLTDLVAHALEAGGAMVPPPADGVPRVPPACPVQMCAGGLDTEVHFRAPASVATLFRAAVRAFTPPGEPRWRGLERLLRHALDEWRRQPRHRDPIFERDGWRCAVPACSARASLHDHHVVYRSRGGDDAWGNRVTICATHHLHGIHGSRVRVQGVAPDDLTWEIGLRDPLPPLLRTHGDRYLPPYTGALDSLPGKRRDALPLAS